MTDRATPTDFEPWVTDELRRIAGVADDPRPAALVAHEVMRLRRAGAVSRRHRRWTPLVGLAAAFVYLAAVFVIGERPAPSPPTADWDAVLVRPEADEAGSNTQVVQVVVVDSGGDERVLRRVDGAALELPITQDGTAFTGAALASQDGWLALEVDSWYREPATQPSVGMSRTTVRRRSWWALVDLRGERPIVMVPYGAHDADALASAGWARDGRFATLCPPDGEAPCGFERVPDLSVQVVDATGDREVLVDGGMALPQQPGQDRITWAADGSGLLTTGDRLPMDELRRIRDERARSGTVDLGALLGSELGIDPGDDPTRVSSVPLPRVLGVPRLVEGSGPRWVVEGGTWLEPHTAIVHRPDGSTTRWATNLPDGTVLREASLSEDGSSVWLLTTEASESPRWMTLARATAPGIMKSLPNAGAVARPSGGDGSIAGIAPDDSLVVLSVVRDWTARGAKVALIRTDGAATPTILTGRFAGFVPSGLALDPSRQAATR